MTGFTCPNDGAPMESDAPLTARERARRSSRPATHVCTECSYTEVR